MLSTEHAHLKILGVFHLFHWRGLSPTANLTVGDEGGEHDLDN